jgi:hypothetical protein
MSPAEMSKVLQRPKQLILKIMKREGLAEAEGERPEHISRADLKAQLKKKAFYSQVKQQLSHDELLYFEEMWVNSLEQFDLDIRPTEELQLKRLILLDIQADRINIQKKEQAEDLARKQQLLNREMGLAANERDREQIAVIQSEIAAIRSALQNFSREAKDLISESKHIQKDLKATRDQRADTIDDSKINFTSWIKVVQDAKFRRGVSAEMEVLKMSTQNAKNKLGEYVEFADGTVDRQLINYETVEEEDEQDGNN